MKADILIFDFDGVIVDTRDYFLPAFITACQEFGYHQIQTHDDFQALFEDNMFDTMVRKGFNREDITPILDRMDIILEPRRLDYRFSTDIVDVLKNLHNRLPMYIVTSNLATIVNDYLDTHDMNVFHDILGSDHHESKSKNIRSILAQHPKQRSVYIGDTIGDIKEAREAGILSIATTWGLHDRNQLEQHSPFQCIDHPHEILDYTI